MKRNWYAIAILVLLAAVLLLLRKLPSPEPVS